MFENVATYFYHNVLSAYMEYVKQRRRQVSGKNKDLRLAINAATALYHLREHLPGSLRKKRTELGISCPDYHLLGDIVNAFKHHEVTKGQPQVVSSEGIYEEIVITEYIDEHGPYYDSEKVIVVTLKDGSTRYLHEILINVVNLWKDELSAIGIIEAKDVNVREKRNLPKRKSKHGAFPLKLEILSLVNFNQRLCLKKYNYVTGQAEPVDITGYSFEMKLYKPVYNLTATLTNKDTGEAISRDIELTEKESLKYHRLESDEARTAFMIEIIKNSKVSKDMVEEAKLIDAKNAKKNKQISA